MIGDEVTVLRETLAAHRAVLSGASATNAELDLERAWQIHAGLAHLLSRWTDFSAGEQRRIVATVELFVNPLDRGPEDGPPIAGLRDPDGFLDDWIEFGRLQAELGLPRPDPVG